jgi:hypothetical protein
MAAKSNSCFGLATVNKCFSSETAWQNGAKFGAPFGQAVSEEKIFLTLANQKQELLLAAVFVGQTERNEETL